MALPANAMTIRKQKGMTPLTSVRLSPVGRLGCPVTRPIKARDPAGVKSARSGCAFGGRCDDLAQMLSLILRELGQCSVLGFLEGIARAPAPCLLLPCDNGLPVPRPSTRRATPAQPRPTVPTRLGGIRPRGDVAAHGPGVADRRLLAPRQPRPVRRTAVCHCPAVPCADEQTVPTQRGDRAGSRSTRPVLKSAAFGRLSC